MYFYIFKVCKMQKWLYRNINAKILNLSKKCKPQFNTLPYHKMYILYYAYRLVFTVQKIKILCENSFI